MGRLAPCLALVLTACGESAPAPVALADFGPAAADAICAWAVRCRHVPDDATCRRLLEPKNYDTRRAQDAVAAGRLAYDPAEGGRCVASTAAAVCLAVPFSDPSCRAMFSGLVGEGGACTSAFDCADHAACAGAVCSAQCCVGSCGPPQPPPEEPPPRAAIGEPCATHTDCVDEAYCELDGRCAALPDAEGERCLFGCARGDLYCDIESEVCRAYAGADEPCDPDGVSAPPCDPAWSYCDAVCRPRPGAGEPCGAPDQTCIAVTFCEQGECQARGGAGSACADSDQCEIACDRAAGVCVGYQTCATP